MVRRMAQRRSAASSEASMIRVNADKLDEHINLIGELIIASAGINLSALKTGIPELLEAASVMIQVGYFKLSHGKRVFKMAPLHHHFELMGWDEVTVVIRFWIICGTAVVTGMSVFYAQWVLGQ